MLIIRNMRICQGKNYKYHYTNDWIKLTGNDTNVNDKTLIAYFAIVYILTIYLELECAIYHHYRISYNMCYELCCIRIVIEGNEFVSGIIMGQSTKCMKQWQCDICLFVMAFLLKWMYMCGTITYHCCYRIFTD